MTLTVKRAYDLPPVPDSITGDLREYLERLTFSLTELNQRVYDSFKDSLVTQHMTRPVDLSGAADTIVVLHAQYAATILRATIIYSEASSADAGIALKLGKESDDDYFFAETSAVSQSLWDETDVALLQAEVSAGDALIFTSAGGKTGTGEVILALQMEYHLR